MPRRDLIVAYMPVLHRGYMQFFRAYPNITECYFFSQELIDSIDYLRKDLRALTPNQQVQTVSGLNLFKTVGIIDAQKIKVLYQKVNKIIAPDEDISRAALKNVKIPIEFYPVFLRWDRRSVEKVNKSDPDSVITEDNLHNKIMKKAMRAAKQSSDIWRRVGAVLITAEGKEYSSKNLGEPSPHSPWINGDPRIIFRQGVGIEMSVYSHAEANIIAQAAKRGIKTDGAVIYVTDFPCPACAKLIAHSGIRTCYYRRGYGVLDGKEIMQSYGVELVQVKLNERPEADQATWVPYSK